MQREILIVSVHVRCIGIRKRLVQRNGSLNRLILGVEHLGHIALQLVALRLHVLNCEADDRTTDLDGHGVLRLQSQFFLEEDDRAELGGVVLDVEAVLLALDDGVAATDTDVVDTHLTLMAAPQLELRLFWCHREQMDVSRGVLVERHRLEQNIVVVIVHLL